MSRITQYVDSRYLIVDINPCVKCHIYLCNMFRIKIHIFIKVTLDTSVWNR